MQNSAVVLLHAGCYLWMLVIYTDKIWIFKNCCRECGTCLYFCDAWFGNWWTHNEQSLLSTVLVFSSLYGLCSWVWLMSFLSFLLLENCCADAAGLVYTTELCEKPLCLLTRCCIIIYLRTNWQVFEYLWVHGCVQLVLLAIYVFSPLDVIPEGMFPWYIHVPAQVDNYME